MSAEGKLYKYLYLVSFFFIFLFFLKILSTNRIGYNNYVPGTYDFKYSFYFDLKLEV